MELVIFFIFFLQIIFSRMISLVAWEAWKILNLNEPDSTVSSRPIWQAEQILAEIIKQTHLNTWRHFLDRSFLT